MGEDGKRSKIYCNYIQGAPQKFFIEVTFTYKIFYYFHGVIAKQTTLLVIMWDKIKLAKLSIVNVKLDPFTVSVPWMLVWNYFQTLKNSVRVYASLKNFISSRWYWHIRLLGSFCNAKANFLMKVVCLIKEEILNLEIVLVTSINLSYFTLKSCYVLLLLNIV